MKKGNKQNNEEIKDHSPRKPEKAANRGSRVWIVEVFFVFVFVSM